VKRGKDESAQAVWVVFPVLLTVQCHQNNKVCPYLL